MENKYLIKKIEIEGYDTEDHLKVSSVVEKIGNIIKNSNSNQVFGINADFGVGKTIFCHRLKKYLIDDFDQIIYLDIWKDDLSDNALMPIVYGISDNLPDGIRNKKKIKKNLKTAGIVLGKTLIKAGEKVEDKYLGTSIIKGLKEMDLDKSIVKLLDGLSEENKKEFENSSYFRNRKLKDNFIETLEKSLKNKKILVMIDELDRCRPDFAIQILEVIKHFFDISNITFFLSVNKNQLQSSVKCIYGIEDFDGYYRKFVDTNFNLPTPDFKNYATYLFKTIGLDYDEENTFVFSGKTRNRGYESLELKNKEDVLINTFSFYSALFNFSTRTQLQVFYKLQNLLNSFNENMIFIPELHISLLCIYEYDIKMFEELKQQRNTSVSLLDTGDSTLSHKYDYKNNIINNGVEKINMNTLEFHRFDENLNRHNIGLSTIYIEENIIKTDLSNFQAIWNITEPETQIKLKVMQKEAFNTIALIEQISGNETQDDFL